MCDIDGLLTTTRKEGNLDGHKKHYAKNCQPMKDLAQVVNEVKPTVSKTVHTISMQQTNLFPVIDIDWCFSHTWTVYTRNSSEYGKIQ